MKILFVADGRSPIALNWMSYFVDTAHEVHLASTFACKPDLNLASFHLVPVAFMDSNLVNGDTMAGIGTKVLEVEFEPIFVPVFVIGLGRLHCQVTAKALENLIDSNKS